MKSENSLQDSSGSGRSVSLKGIGGLAGKGEVKRLYYLDYARGIGIILVVLAHIQYISEPLRIFLVSFHIPLFFIISGFLINIKNEAGRALKDILSGKFRRMLIPYYVYSVIDMLIYAIYFFITGRDGGLSTIMLALVQTLTFYGYSVLWFLPAIFFGEVIFLWIKRLMPRACHIVLALSAMLSFWINPSLEAWNIVNGNAVIPAILHLVAVTLLRIPLSAAFVGIGYYIAALWKKAGGLSPLKSSALTVPVDFLLSINLFLVCFFLGRINGMTDLHFLLLGNFFLYYIVAAAGSLGVILLCKAISGLHTNFFHKLLSLYGRESLFIMATHIDFYVLLMAEIGGQLFTKPLPAGDLKNTVFILLTLFFTMLGETVMVLMKKKFFVKSQELSS